MKRSDFSADEIAYLHEGRRLGRLATADTDGRPQVTPVGMWSYNPATGTIDVTGHDFETTRKFRNVVSNPRAAFVVDDMASVDPWRPRAVTVEGTAEAIPSGDGGNAMIRLTPDRIVSWGLAPG